MPPHVPSDHDIDSPSNASHMPTRAQYPNPGYLGSSSHDTIFKRLDASSQDSSSTLSLSVGANGVNASVPLASSIAFKRAVWAIEQARAGLDYDSCGDLTTQWLNTGLNFALAGPLTASCAESAVKKLHRGTYPAIQTCHELFVNSARPISAGPGSTLEAYCDNFCSVGNIRWETLGIFFTSLSRALNDLQNCGSPFHTREQRRRFQKLSLALADECLEAVMSLDCLNDLQLIFQYELFNAHSVADGDQSKDARLLD